MLALLGLAACVEKSSGTDSTVTDTGQTTADETGAPTGATAPGTGSSDGPGSSSEGSGSSSDDGTASSTGAALEDPCLAFSVPCPAECLPMPTYPQNPGSCDVLSSEVVLCVSPGEPLGPGPTTYYAEIDGEIRYAVVGQYCTDSPLATPIGWTECSGAPGQPEPCSCLCGSQGCPAEAEFLLLTACGLPEPCGEVVVNEFDSPSDYDLCVLAALRDRIPGAYAASRTNGYSSDVSHVFFGGGEAAQLVRKKTSDLCFSALGYPWKPARTCTLRPPAWFDACIADPTMHPDCLYGESWFDGCVELPASCP